MKKLKIYLDTSVISHLDQPEKKSECKASKLLWDDIKKGKYDVYTSDVAFAELNKCTEEKRTILAGYLNEIEYTHISINDEIEQVADKIIKLGILKPAQRDDCYHIASGVVSECKYIVSLNFKHLVNVKTVDGVRAITNLYGYNNIDIIPPNMLVEGDDDNE